jgi:MFS family permease
MHKYEKTQTSTSKAIDFNFSVLSKNFKRYLFIIVLFTLGNSTDAFLIFKAEDTGISIALIPILWVVLHFVKMAISMPGGILSDKIGRKKVIIAGWCVYALIYLGFGFSFSIWHIWLLFALYGIYFGLTEGVEKAFVSDLIVPEFHGTAFGFYHLAIGISAFPSSVVFGFLWQRFGASVAFFYGSILAGISSLLLMFLVKEKIKENFP